MSELTRREFLKASGVAMAGMVVASNTILGKKYGHKAPSDKMNILGVGIGGRGAGDLEEMETENIIGLADVDWKYAAKVFDKYPKAKRFNDYRKLYDAMLKDADGVMVATADHTHCIIAADAITAGKNVYVEKPMTLYVYESRLLAKLAKKYKVATQMGNQGASVEGTRRALNWLWEGEIGEVTRIESYTNRPIWPQGLATPKDKPAIPDTLNWDAFIGPAHYRDYNPAYHPWNFRGWWDFGSGALGDMANHILQVAFKGLNLGYPVKVCASSSMLMSDSCPSSEMISYRFAARENMPKLALPACELVWFDGGLRPEIPITQAVGKGLCSDGVCIFYGTKDTLVVNSHGSDAYLTSGRNPQQVQHCRVINTSHQQDWIRACKESPENRVETASCFAESGPLNESIVMGCAAVRLQDLEQWLDWDGENMQFTNIPKNATIKGIVEDKFSVQNGNPTFNRVYSEKTDANEYARQLIKPVYRKGWTLPEIPMDV